MKISPTVDRIIPSSTYLPTLLTDFSALPKAQFSVPLLKQAMHSHDNNTSNNILYLSQRENKAVVRSYTLTHNEEWNCTHTHTLSDIRPLPLNLHTLKH